MADGSVLTRSYSMEGHMRSFHTLTEVRKFLQFCDMQIMAQSGTRENLVTFKRPD